MKIFGLFLVALAAWGQAPPAAPQGGALIPVRFQVAPQKGKPVSDLRIEDIEVREDGAARKAAILQGGAGNQRDYPLEISLLFDCSRTELASGTLDPKVFQEGLLNEFPNATIAIYGFAPGLKRLVAPTRDLAQLAKAMETAFLVHPLTTALMDQISSVMVDAGSTEGAAVRLVVVFSSGQTDQGSFSADDQQKLYQRTVDIAQRANINLYPAVLIPKLATQDATPGNAPLTKKGSGPQVTSSEMSAITALRVAGNFANLGPTTGGKRIEILSAGNMLPTVLKALADEMRTEYVAGFEVSPSSQRKKHKIEVVIKNKDRGKVTTGGLNLVY